jgi:hypothetical protein
MLGWWLACGPSTPEELEAFGDQAESIEERAEAYGAACVAGRITACLSLAGLEGAPEQARTEAAEAACEAGEADGCLLRTESPGDRWGVKACEGGRGAACLAAAEVASDPRDRARLLGQACHQAELQACLPAALAWRGLGERTRSAALYGVACEGGREGACWLRDRMKEEADRAEACAAGDGPACEALCLRDGVGCEAVVDTLEGSCRDGRAVACTRRGLVAADRGDGDAGDWLWLGCDGVDPWACVLLADRVEAGMPLPEKARGDVGWLRNQACDLQLDYGCAKAP